MRQTWSWYNCCHSKTPKQMVLLFLDYSIWAFLAFDHYVTEWLHHYFIQGKKKNTYKILWTILLAILNMNLFEFSHGHFSFSCTWTNKINILIFFFSFSFDGLVVFLLLCYIARNHYDEPRKVSFRIPHVIVLSPSTNTSNCFLDSFFNSYFLNSVYDGFDEVILEWLHFLF